MRWWMTIDPPCIMSVDNASVTGMDFSELVIDNPDLWMVNWTEGKGEIENQIVVDGSGQGDKNLNGLREDFYDITPYVPLFQQFMVLMQAKNLLLNQAKKIQIDLIKQLFESKRQLPFHYTVAAGDYWWDASDDAMGASSTAGLQNAIAKINELVANLNSVVPGLNNNDGSICYQTTNLVATPTNNATSTILSEVNGKIVNIGNAINAHINDTILGTAIGGGPSGPNTVNNLLRRASITGYPEIGLVGAIAKITFNFDYIANPYACSTIGVSPVSFSGISNVATSNQQWIPVGGTAPVNVTPAEQAAIINGIAVRTNQLALVKNSKISAVNALTTVPDVIAYDVLADWPSIPVPPGYKLPAPTLAASSATIIGTPPAPSGGIPEAPSDDVTYGRRNMVWNPALALSGDILDGGNF